MTLLRMARLNGWQRIGIVVSVIWAIGGGLWGNQIGLDQAAPAIFEYKVCLEANPYDGGKCSRGFDQAYSEDIADRWLYAAGFAFVPILIGWLTIYCLLGIGRWIGRGFSDTDRESSGES